MKDYFKNLLIMLIGYILVYLFVKIPAVESTIDKFFEIFKRMIDLFI